MIPDSPIVSGRLVREKSPMRQTLTPLCKVLRFPILSYPLLRFSICKLMKINGKQMVGDTSSVAHSLLYLPCAL